MAGTGPIVLADPVVRSHPLARGLLAWWLARPGRDCGPTWYDLTGRSRGTLTNGPTWGRAHRPGGSGNVQLDGSDDWVDCGTAAALSPPELTILAWIRVDSFTPAYSAIVSRNDGSAYAQLFIKSNGTLAVYCSQSFANYDGTGSHTLAAGTWYRIGWTWSAASGIVGYVNGEVDATANGTGTQPVVAASFAIGHDTVNAGRHFPGAIDDVKVWSRPLAAAEIRADLEESRAGYPGTLRRRGPARLTWLAPGITLFSVTGSGGLALGGSATRTPTFAPAPAGGLALSGSATVAPTFAPAPSGGVILSGAATPTPTFAPAPSGGLILSGIAVAAPTFTPAASGGVVLGGTATTATDSTFSVTASGGPIVAGSASAAPTFAPAPSGGITLSGAATPAPTWSATASGGVVLSGGATVSRDTTFTVAASGGWALSGSAPTAPTFGLTAAGGVVLSGSATLAAAYTLTGSGRLTLGGVAVVALTGDQGSGPTFFVCDLAAGGWEATDLTAFDAAPDDPGDWESTDLTEA